MCESHIIPEFCYKPIYDEKHRMIAVEPSDPSDKGYKQKGIRSELLCEDCEGLINDSYEKPFRKYWIEGKALAPLQEGSVVVLDRIDYGSFKLFHLSVLFRASASDHPNYREVDLGPHTEQIRRMIMNGMPGPDSQYPIVCLAVEGTDGEIWDELVGPAHRVKLYGHWGYYFTFAGAQWMYFVSSHPAPDIEVISLTASGTLPIVKSPWMAIDHYRDLRRSRTNP